MTLMHHRLKTLYGTGLIGNAISNHSNAIESRVPSSFRMNLSKFSGLYWSDTEESGKDEDIRM